MSKAPGDAESIQATIYNHIRKTMNVVQGIKGNTEKLLEKTDNIIDMLAEKDPRAPGQDPIVEAEIEEVAELEEAVIDLELAEATELTTQLDPALIDAISKACVKEVMARINPVLEALQKFINANTVDKPQQQEIDDDAFAEKLIEEMKLSLGRRQRIALARKRMTAP
jgi:hypothetical protein